MNIIFHSFYYIIYITCSSNLTYTKKFLEKQYVNKIQQTDLEIYQNLTWSTTCCMWRAEKVLRLEEKTNLFLCRVPNKYTQQTYFFTECICLPSVSTNGHSTNVLTDGTRTNGCPRGGSLPSA